MRPIVPEPDLSERIHDSVLDAICSGELKAGARITQEELAQKFGVSRQPVLQAMMLLRREGFLIDAGRKGVCVAPLDVQQARRRLEEELPDGVTVLPDEQHAILLIKGDHRDRPRVQDEVARHDGGTEVDILADDGPHVTFELRAAVADGQRCAVIADGADPVLRHP